MEGTYVQTPYLPDSLRESQKGKHVDVFIHSCLLPFPATLLRPLTLDLKQG
jgi:hypothetical protein